MRHDPGIRDLFDALETIGADPKSVLGPMCRVIDFAQAGQAVRRRKAIRRLQEIARHQGSGGDAA